MATRCTRGRNIPWKFTDFTLSLSLPRFILLIFPWPLVRKKNSVIFRVYCADHTYCTLRFPMNTTAEVIKACAADKLQLNRANEDLVLVEVKSNGERTVYKDHDVSIPTALCLNGRIFVSPKDHIDALVSRQIDRARSVCLKKVADNNNTKFMKIMNSIHQTLRFRLICVYFVVSCRHRCPNRRVRPMASKWTWRRWAPKN